MTSAQKMTRIRKTLDTEARHLDYAARDELTRAWMAFPLRDFEASISGGYLHADPENPHVGSTPAGEVLKRDEDGEPVSVRTRGGIELHRAVVNGRKAWVTIPEDGE